jgi:hypothetical protein
MSTSQNTGLLFLSDFFSLESILTMFDLSTLPEFAAVALTVLAGLGAGVLSMLAVMILMDLVGGHLDWWDDHYSLKNWLSPPETAANLEP